METTPKMQEVITRLMHKHERRFFPTPNYHRLTLYMDGFPPLGIQVYPYTLSVAHYVDDDAFITEPDVLFLTRGEEWVPVARSHYFSPARTWNPFKKEHGGMIEHFYALHFEQSVWERSRGAAELMPISEEKQAQTAHFCEAWAHRLEQQGWLERGEA